MFNKNNKFSVEYRNSEGLDKIVDNYSRSLFFFGLLSFPAIAIRLAHLIDSENGVKDFLSAVGLSILKYPMRYAGVSIFSYCAVQVFSAYLVEKFENNVDTRSIRKKWCTLGFLGLIGPSALATLYGINTDLTKLIDEVQQDLTFNHTSIPADFAAVDNALDDESIEVDIPNDSKDSLDSFLDFMNSIIPFDETTGNQIPVVEDDNNYYAEYYDENAYYPEYYDEEVYYPETDEWCYGEGYTR